MDVPTSDFDQRVVDKVLRYLQSSTTSTIDYKHLLRLVEQPASRSPVTLTVPVDETEERAELINQLWKLIPGCSTGTDSKADRETRAWFQAALAIISIPTLRSFKNDIPALISYCEKTRAWTLFGRYLI